MSVPEGSNVYQELALRLHHITPQEILMNQQNAHMRPLKRIAVMGAALLVAHCGLELSTTPPADSEPQSESPDQVGHPSQPSPKPGGASTSRIECTENPNTGKQDVCRCIVNEKKTKVAAIIKRGAAMDDSQIITEANRLLQSIQSDGGSAHVGVHFFKGSTLQDLKTLTERLYDEHDVAYIIYIGYDLVTTAGTAGVIDGIGALSVVRKSSEEADNNRDAECRDIAMSWVVPPGNVSDRTQRQFVSNVLRQYTRYHDDRALRAQYNNTYLRIFHDDAECEGDPLYDEDDTGYRGVLTGVNLENSDFSSLQSALREHPRLIVSDVHGNSDLQGLGLTGECYTSISDYDAYVTEHGTPALLWETGSCEAFVVTPDDPKDPDCCWPQAYQRSGVWAYYSFLGNAGMQKRLAEGATIGQAIRSMPYQGQYQYFVIGDITAHLH